VEEMLPVLLHFEHLFQAGCGWYPDDLNTAHAMQAERLGCVFSCLCLSEGDFNNQQGEGTKNHLLLVSELRSLLFLVLF